MDWWDVRLRQRWMRLEVGQAVPMECPPVWPASEEARTERRVWAALTALPAQRWAARRPARQRGARLEWAQPELVLAQPSWRVWELQGWPAAGPMRVPLPGVARREPVPDELAPNESAPEELARDGLAPEELAGDGLARTESTQCEVVETPEPVPCGWASSDRPWEPKQQEPASSELKGRAPPRPLVELQTPRYTRYTGPARHQGEPWPGPLGKWWRNSGK
jgi:hypothetical protein